MTEEQVRQEIIRKLPAFGIASTEPNWEASLIEGGQLIGRRFEFDGLHVYWLRSRHTIEFYSQDWMLLGEWKVEQLSSAA